MAHLEPGDVYVVANNTTEPVDPRQGIKGWGRILHCAHDLTPKAEILTGDYGLVIGLALDPRTGTLFGTSPQMSRIMAWDAEGNPVDFARPPRRRYGNLVVDDQGRIVIGVHSGHGEPAPDDGWGEGKLVRFDPVGGDFEFFEVEIDGGRGGKHWVSNLCLAPDQRTVFYVSEAGRRVCRYDLEDRRQLPDFHVFPDGEDGTYGMGITDAGEVVMATGVGALRFDADAKLIERYDVPAMRGWTRAKLSPDGKHFYLGNFMEGVLQRREVEGGAVVAETNINRRGALTSVVEYAPAGR